MKKLNNKGLSIIELLVCFVIVALIAITLLNIIMEYKGVQETESIKNLIRTYKDEVTHVIQQDIISYTLSSATSSNDIICPYDENQGEAQCTTITLTFKNKVYDVADNVCGDNCYKKDIVVHIDNENNKNNYIAYPDSKQQEIRYYLPTTTTIYTSSGDTKNDINFNSPTTHDGDCEDNYVCNDVFKLHIPIEHSEIDGTYAIDIVTPVTP